ncbi:MAG: cyanophycinase [Caldilineaceae bacterium]
MSNSIPSPVPDSQLSADPTSNFTVKSAAKSFSTRALLFPPFSASRALVERFRAPVPKLLMPMGGGYAEVLQGFAEALFIRADGTNVRVTVVPASFGSNPFAISESERAQHMACAERRRQMIESALRAAAPKGMTCDVALAPIFVRGEAQDEANLRYFGSEVDAVFLLGGDQAVAMRVLQGTAVEAAIDAIYRRSGIIAGTSAGAGMQALAMLAGFQPGYSMQNSLHVGAAAVWNSDAERGLACGTPGVIFDQHFFQRGRLGRLLEAMTQAGAPGVGVGIDAYTGLQVHEDGDMGAVYGCYSVAVLDAESCGAAAHACRGDSRDSISVRNVLVHLLAPGGSSYDLQTRSHSLAPSPHLPETRRFDGLVLPPGAGPLFLCGSMDIGRRAHAEAWHQFETMCANWAGSAIRAEALLGTKTALIADIPEEVSDQKLAIGREAWLHGTPLWLEGAYAAAAGTHRCTGVAPQTTRDPEDLSAQEAAKIAARRALVVGNVALEDGCGLLAANFEPCVVEHGAWGRLFALAYEHHEQPAFGLGANTALVLTAGGAKVIGEEAVVALDLRTAARDLGSNGAYVVANGLLDVFVEGETVEPRAASAACLPLAELQRKVSPEDGAVLRC